MIIKNFGGKQITIRELKKGDLKIAHKFVDFVNSLVAEDAKISTREKITLKEGKAHLLDNINEQASRRRVYLMAECDGMIVGMTGVEQLTKRSDHIGQLGIMIRDGYRGLGLGKFLMKEIIKLAKKEIRPKPKMIRLFVYVNNKPAVSLYKKIGFKKMATLQKHVQYKGELIGEHVMVLDV